MDLLDNNEQVIASAGMLLDEYKIAIDPIDLDSQRIFEAAGYKIISSKDFDINMLKQSSLKNILFIDIQQIDL